MGPFTLYYIFTSLEPILYTYQDSYGPLFFVKDLPHSDSPCIPTKTTIGALYLLYLRQYAYRKEVLHKKAAVAIACGTAWTGEFTALFLDLFSYLFLGLFLGLFQRQSYEVVDKLRHGGTYGFKCFW